MQYKVHRILANTPSKTGKPMDLVTIERELNNFLKVKRLAEYVEERHCLCEMGWRQSTKTVSAT
jgi:hypothetical protein